MKVVGFIFAVALFGVLGWWFFFKVAQWYSTK